MHFRLSKLGWSGVVLLVAGPSIFLGKYVWLKTRTEEPIVMPVSLKPGPVHTRSFRVNEEWPYELVLEVDPGMEGNRVVCLLGADIPSDHCTGPAVVHATWMLRNNGELIASGQDNRQGDLGGDTDRTLGRFALKKGRAYALDVDFTADGRVLDRLHPRIKVVAIDGGFFEEQWIYLYFLYLPLGVFIAFVGAVILLLASIRSRRVAHV